MLTFCTTTLIRSWGASGEKTKQTSLKLKKPRPQHVSQWPSLRKPKRWFSCGTYIVFYFWFFSFGRICWQSFFLKSLWVFIFKSPDYSHPKQNHDLSVERVVSSLMCFIVSLTDKRGNAVYNPLHINHYHLRRSESFVSELVVSPPFKKKKSMVKKYRLQRIMEHACCNTQKKAHRCLSPSIRMQTTVWGEGF